MKKNICFVCWANVCRSPMAEVIFQNELAQRNLTDRFEAFSAGIGEEKQGQPMDASAVKTLSEHGLEAPARRAWVLSKQDYTRFDFFLCMDMEVLWTLKMRFSGDPEHKIGLLMAYTDTPREVEDPYMTGRFEKVYEELNEGCQAFLNALLES